MFCTKCGKQLYDGDAFCAHCGAKVREELLFKTEVKSTPRTPRYDDIVFNPPFKAEAERRTQHIAEETNPYSSEPKKERLSLDWNLDGFPAADRRRDEGFEINWDAVIEKKRESRTVNVEKILPETGFKKEEEVPVVEIFEEKKEDPFETETLDLFKTEEDDKPLSIEELERALFGTEEYTPLDIEAPDMTVEYKAVKEAKKKEQEFFTYNSQRDAFQELLDKERARIEALENERKSQWDEITPAEEIEYVPKKALDFEEVFKEPKLPLVPPLKEVAVVVPPLTARVMADDPMNIVEPEYEVVLPPLTARVVAETQVVETQVVEAQIEEKVEEEAFPFPSEEIQKQTEEKTKLRYSDVFPVGAFDSVSDDKSGKHVKEEVDEDDDDDDDERGGNKLIKALIIILALVVILELVVIGVKFLAPESKLALTVDGLMDKVTSLFAEEDEEEPPVINVEETRLETYVKELSSSATNVGIIKHDENLKYDLSKTYAFDEVSQTEEFEDVAWNSQSDKTNGYYIVEAVISYYDTWKANHEESEDVIGVNQVTIGEIRTDSNGHYVLNKVIYATAEGDVLEKVEIVYLEASEGKIIVKEVKEESV